ncbi:RNA-directed DNA polymerase from mobile element jockey-like [Plakobranchus ocellatus]|uniref:RNA-directed DNA polymerase from mobile element jockey-like n=1 Tax=Plakobranchus ocellatus TaxID=259542 RepID=A0AAV3ZQ40_9GAST|nr:RNA-directed DNA polymerase from mobile element jockey-like [Plakobranchus ocellatus]
MLRVPMKRMRNKLLPEVSEIHYGFMADRGTRNDIFVLRTFMERAIEVQDDLHLCFIDYSKAFDKVKDSDLFGILLRRNCDRKDLRVIRNLYWEQESAIRVDNDCSKYRPVCKGVR